MNIFAGKKGQVLANLMLLLVGAVWGSGFVVMKNALESVSVNYLIAARFSISALGLCCFLFNRKKPLSRRLVLGGILSGALLYGGLSTQTYGLAGTTAGKNALITAFYVVLVPFLHWAVNHEKPERRTIVAAVLMLLGIALLSLKEDLTLGAGDAMTLLCAVLYAAQIVAVAAYEDCDVMQFSAVQFAAGAAIAWLAALCFEQPPAAVPKGTVLAMLYCGAVVTLLGFTLMNIGIRAASPGYASLLLSTESAFGCIFGVIFLQEALNGRMLAGGALILAALVVSQVDWRSLRRGEKSNRCRTHCRSGEESV